MSETTVLNMVRDAAGQNTFGVLPSNVAFAGILTTDTPASFTVPEDANNYLVVFSFSGGSNVFVDTTGVDAVIPNTDSQTTTGFLNPGSLQVRNGASISLITPDVNGAYYTAQIYVVYQVGN